MFDVANGLAIPTASKVLRDKFFTYLSTFDVAKIAYVTADFVAGTTTKIHIYLPPITATYGFDDRQIRWRWRPEDKIMPLPAACDCVTEPLFGRYPKQPTGVCVLDHPDGAIRRHRDIA